MLEGPSDVEPGDFLNVFVGGRSTVECIKVELHILRILLSANAGIK